MRYSTYIESNAKYQLCIRAGKIRLLNGRGTHYPDKTTEQQVGLCAGLSSSECCLNLFNIKK